MAVPAVIVSPIVAVLDQADLPPLDPGDRAGTAGVAVSLVEAFEHVPDPRQARGIRHPLVPLLVLAACAVMTGARSFAAIGEYARDKGRLVLDALCFEGEVAHAATIRRVLVNLDPACRVPELGHGVCQDSRLWVPESRRTSCDLLILVDEPA
jgi:hypothetical protein